MSTTADTTSSLPLARLSTSLCVVGRDGAVGPDVGDEDVGAGVDQSKTSEVAAMLALFVLGGSLRDASAPRMFRQL